MSGSPRVSVVMPSYNHAAYIGEAIESVFAQSVQDFEILITDDGSKDHTRTVLDKFSDKRIRVFYFPENRGACEATNHSIRHSTGDFVAILNSDDVWRADKLALQIEELEKSPEAGAVFTGVEFIDEKGRSLSQTSHFYKNVFITDNLKRGEWLRRFFYRGNCLCHPSVLVRRAVFDRIGLYDNRYRQLPDFEMWVRLAKAYEIRVLKSELTKFRLLAAEQNTSAPSRENSARLFNELLFVYKDFFKDCPAELFNESFGGISKILPSNQVEVFCAGIDLLLKERTHIPQVSRMAGLELLFHGLHDRSVSPILKSRFEIDELKMQEISKSVDSLYLGFLNSPDGIPTRKILTESGKRLVSSAGRRIRRLFELFSILFKSREPHQRV